MQKKLASLCYSNLGAARVVFLFGMLFINSCSSELNPMGFLATPFSENAVDLRSRAFILYDDGNFDEALTYASKAYELDPESEEGSLILSSIHMGLAGIDSFQLVKNLMNQSEDTSLQESNAASSLAQLSDLIGLSADEYENLTLEDNVKDGIQGAPTTGVFSTLPVLLPKSAVEARISGGTTVYHISQAIEVLCPFVSDDVKILGESGDIRHTSTACSPKGNQELTAKSHFNWAFAHLAEAILFHGVVLYAPDSDIPNLQARGDLLSVDGSTSSISEYVSAVNELAAVTDIIMPTDATAAEESMLLAMFQDLEAASAGLSSLAGIPESVTGSIVSSLSSLQEQRDAITPSSGENQSTSVLKDQLTSGLAIEIQSQITEKHEAGELTASEKNELCDAYSSISTQAFDLCDS